MTWLGVTTYQCVALAFAVALGAQWMVDRRAARQPIIPASFELK